MNHYKEFREKSSEELLEQASGRARDVKEVSDVALTEVNRRSMSELKKSIDDFSKSTEKHNRVLVGLTIVLTFVAIIQVYIAATESSFHWTFTTAAILGALILVVFVTKDIKK